MRLFLILISIFGLNVFAKISPEELAKVEELKVKVANGDAAALCDLGFRYIKSDGVPRDTLKGIEMMKQSAEKGYFPAENNLSEWYMTGLGHNGVTFIKKNWGEMYKWCKKSADQKSIYGFYLLGMYFSKNPEECSKPGGYTEAIKWFRLAAENGWVAAQYELGNLYSPNPNIPDRKYPPAVNREESAKWFLSAAMRGHIKAQVKMGGYYEEGIGVPMDKIDAYAFYYLAAIVREDGDVWYPDCNDDDWAANPAAWAIKNMNDNWSQENIIKVIKRRIELDKEIEENLRREGRNYF